MIKTEIKTISINIISDKSIYVYCPYCKLIHSHGLSEGVRYSHCNEDNRLYNCVIDENTIKLSDKTSYGIMKYHNKKMGAI